MLKKNGFAPVGAVVLAILYGTLMPGRIKSAIEDELPHVLPWAGLAHFWLFALLAWVVCQRGGARAVGQALLLAAVLACATEWLQQWVPGRHPRLADVAIDICGALLGCAVAAAMQWRAQTKRRSAAIAADRP